MTPVAELTDAPWLSNRVAQAALAALAGAGHQGFFVGGCVRNGLLGQLVNDLDIATDALPEQVMDLAKRAGLKAIGTGVAHGTVTVTNGHQVVEVTTYRQDVATDGRRAVVRFSRDMAVDAARRDFTMNALYADGAGHVYDPLGGLGDLRAGRVRFIGDAAQRIAEDRLRILRYFRFQAWYGDPQEGPQDEALAACAEAAEGVEGLSKERLGAEMRKLLAAPDPAPATATMAQCGVLWRILPGAAALALAPLVHLEGVYDVSPSWLRRMAALGLEPGEACAALRLSKAETRALEARKRALAAGGTWPQQAYRFGAEAARDAALIVQASLPAPPPVGLLDGLERAEAQRFPLTADDVIPPLAPGRAVGRGLASAEEAWVEAGFALSRDRLVEIALAAAARPEDPGPKDARPKND